MNETRSNLNHYLTSSASFFSFFFFSSSLLLLRVCFFVWAHFSISGVHPCRFPSSSSSSSFSPSLASVVRSSAFPPPTHTRLFLYPPCALSFSSSALSLSLSPSRWAAAGIGGFLLLSLLLSLSPHNSFFSLFVPPSLSLPSSNKEGGGEGRAHPLAVETVTARTNNHTQREKEAGHGDREETQTDRGRRALTHTRCTPRSLALPPHPPLLFFPSFPSFPFLFTTSHYIHAHRHGFNHSLAHFTHTQKTCHHSFHTHTQRLTRTRTCTFFELKFLPHTEHRGITRPRIQN